MTVLVADLVSWRTTWRLQRSAIFAPVAMTAWAVQPSRSGKQCFLTEGSLTCDPTILDCTFEEFLSLLAEGGKIVDVRHLQEPK